MNNLHFIEKFKRNNNNAEGISDDDNFSMDHNINNHYIEELNIYQKEENNNFHLINNSHNNPIQDYNCFHMQTSFFEPLIPSNNQSRIYYKNNQEKVNENPVYFLSTDNTSKNINFNSNQDTTQYLLENQFSFTQEIPEDTNYFQDQNLNCELMKFNQNQNDPILTNNLIEFTEMNNIGCQGINNNLFFFDHHNSHLNNIQDNFQNEFRINSFPVTFSNQHNIYCSYEQNINNCYNFNQPIEISFAQNQARKELFEEKMIYKKNFQEILIKIELFFRDFLLTIESEDKTECNISIIDLEKNAYFDFDCGFYKLPEVESCSFTKINLVKNLERFTKIINILSVIYVRLYQNCTLTKREIYYNDVELFKGTQSVDSILHDVCSILNVTRFEIYVFPAQKGLFAGVFEIYDSFGQILALNTPLNSNKVNLITSNFLDEFKIFTNAKYILIVEKETIFNSIISNEKFRVILCDFMIITGKGYSDYLTKLFIKKISDSKPEIKLFYFGDLDPHGLEIYLNYLFGSRQSARENHLLSINKIYWLGLSYETIDLYLLTPEGVNDIKSLIELNECDMKKIQNMLDDSKVYFLLEKWGCSSNKNQDFIVGNLMKINHQFDLMIEKNYRAEAELIVSKRLDILIDLIFKSEYFR